MEEGTGFDCIQCIAPPPRLVLSAYATVERIRRAQTTRPTHGPIPPPPPSLPPPSTAWIACTG
eukprot:6162012-Pleurochrysis_carterae.AAC.1